MFYFSKLIETEKDEYNKSLEISLNFGYFSPNENNNFGFGLQITPFYKQNIYNNSKCIKKIFAVNLFKFKLTLFNVTFRFELLNLNLKLDNLDNIADFDFEFNLGNISIYSAKN